MIEMDDTILDDNGGGVAKLEVEKDDDDGRECSRGMSRIARESLSFAMGTQLKLAQYSFMYPKRCRIAPQRDMFQKQESAKEQLRGGIWKCAICGKHFRAEEFIDKHMDNRHADLRGKDESAVCMADFCDILHCDEFQKLTTHHQFAQSHRDCDEVIVDRIRAACVEMADECFPIQEDTNRATAHLRKIFLHEVCDAHSCDRDYKLYSLKSSFFASDEFTLGHLALAVFGCMSLFIVLAIYFADYISNETIKSGSHLRRIDKVSKPLTFHRLKWLIYSFVLRRIRKQKKRK